MTKYLAAYAAALVVMTAIDLLWLGVIARPLYQQGIGHLMAEQPKIWVGALFYVVFPIGLMLFAVVPNEAAAQWSKTLVAAALFGFFAYATYDLTNLATLKAWPWSLALMDTVWGTFVSAVSAAAAKGVLNQFAGN